MQFIKICALFIILIGTSCKKERTCQCTNSIATYEAGTIDGTKNQAKKYCKTLSAGETECKLKE
jgi:hypothetical protein